jgi:hypothetical protein
VVGEPKRVYPASCAASSPCRCVSRREQERSQSA